MAERITTFLMFDGEAEEAMKFYVSLFKNSAVTSVKRYKAGETGRPGSVVRADFRLDGQPFMCVDSPVELSFDFAPSMSLFVTCETEQEIENLFKRLSAGGRVMMPLDDYPFSAKFAWLSDRFGVSWQLSLPAR
jgi:predicted 3-demethylubiquinone-9 3-methyltransferase (glyoxalase superfamily)